MFRTLTCPSSEGKIVLSQHLVSSLSVKGCTVCWMRADCRLHNTINRFYGYYSNNKGYLFCWSQFNEFCSAW